MKYKKEFEEFMVSQNPNYWCDRHFQIVGNSYAMRELNHSYPIFEAMHDKFLAQESEIYQLRQKLEAAEAESLRLDDECHVFNDELEKYKAAYAQVSKERDGLLETLRKALEQAPYAYVHIDAEGDDEFYREIRKTEPHCAPIRHLSFSDDVTDSFSQERIEFTVEKGGTATAKPLYAAPVPAMPVQDDKTPVSNELIDFLHGKTEINGCAFGEKPAGEGMFWWRKLLPRFTNDFEVKPS